LLGHGDTVVEARACRNVHPNPATHFEIDPAPLLAAHRAARAGGARVIGHYHSHPSGAPTPSLTDAACAAPDGSLWLIAASGEVRAWRAVPHGALHGRFDPVALHVIADPAT
jgi:proteasome lid subunit RPN8/RPN11